MKSVHLICNAHIDPVWQWEWEEGASAALSTFRAAADLCDKFDYIFCHNETLLYQYIERYDPALFHRIGGLIAAGKWRVMGGWYLQPDCNLPCGESLVRQILAGRDYFRKKFGVRPEIAFNPDSFGHSVGLPQILKKCGFRGYLICRPHAGQFHAPPRYLWESPDGSRVTVERALSYNTPLGGAAEEILARAAAQSGEVCCVLWGVGNHGGGPSRRDLREIQARCTEEAGFRHSWPEAYFSEAKEPETVVRRSLRHSMPGCYVSMSRLKRAHIEVENLYFSVEKQASTAALHGLKPFPREKMREALESLLRTQFHDVLPGTCIRPGEEEGLAELYSAKKLLREVRAEALFAMAQTYPSAEEGEYPIFVFNDQPYPVRTLVEAEFSLADQNPGELRSVLSVSSGEEKLPCQVIAEGSTINLDWRKRLVCEVELRPLALTRLDVRVRFEVPAPVALPRISGNFCHRDDRKTVEIDWKTGNILRYAVDGIEYLRAGGAAPVLYEDNADPWGMGEEQQRELGCRPEEVAFVPGSLEVVEEGELLTVLQCFYRGEGLGLRKEYRIPKSGPGLEIRLEAEFGLSDRLLRLHLPLSQPEGEFIGQTAYATEPLDRDGRECACQRFAALRYAPDRCLAVFNDCIYGHSLAGETLRLSLLRGTVYCAHPIAGRPLVPAHKRHVERMDQGEHFFRFFLTVCPQGELERRAALFCRPPYALNFFPQGRGENLPGPRLSDPDVVLSAFKPTAEGEGFVFRLFNNAENSRTCTLYVGETSVDLRFSQYEVKTVCWDGSDITESEGML